MSCFGEGGAPALNLGDFLGGEGRRGACLHPLIDRGLLTPIAECLSSAGSSSRLCRQLPLLFLGIQGISAAHRG